jgi:hypothetical protein
MKDFTLKIASTVLAAALVANVGLLWRMSERLTALETKLELLTHNNFATK